MKVLHFLIFFISVSSLIAHTTIFETLKVGIEGYLFAYPLVDFEATKTYTGEINEFHHISYLPNPDTKIIVRPNVDTLYSFAFLDITQEPLYLMMPDTNDRYYVLEIMDAWTNVFGSYGKRTTGTQKQEFFITNSEWKGIIPEGLTHIISPTHNAWIAGRIQTNGEGDVANVSSIQEQMILKRYSEIVSRELNLRDANDNKTSPDFVVAQMTTEEFFNNFTESLKNNAPAKEDAEILDNLKKIGIEPGKDWNQTSLSLINKLTLRTAATIAQGIINNGISFLTAGTKTVNGWVYKTDTIGNYSTQYMFRAVVAHIGLAANLPLDAVYCNGYNDENDEVLNGVNNYVLHLNKEDLPPVNAFWSLTMYDENSYLVPNEANKYTIRDRDALTFNADGSLDIYIQSEKPSDDKISNWLPSPKTKFNLTLRLYWPKQSVFDKTWTPKGIQKV